MNNRRLVYMGNSYVEASYKSTPIEKKILNLAVLQANKKDFPDKPNPHMTYYVKISRDELLNIAGLDMTSDFRNIMNACKSLNEKIIVYSDEAGKEFETSSFVSNTKFKAGELTIGFSGRVVPFFNKLKKRFTSYDLLQIKHFTGKYSIRFYELCKQFENIGHREISIKQLRKMFQLENSYKNFSDFRKRVIDTAQAELQEKSDIYFEYQQKKAGKKIVAIKMVIKLNTSSLNKDIILIKIYNYLGNTSIEEFYRTLKLYYKARGSELSVSEKQTITNILIKKPNPETLQKPLLSNILQWIGNSNKSISPIETELNELGWHGDYNELLEKVEEKAIEYYIKNLKNNLKEINSKDLDAAFVQEFIEVQLISNATVTYNLMQKALEIARTNKKNSQK